MDIGERLRKERQRLGMSQTELGAVGGLGKSTVIAYEAGRSYPDARFLAGLAERGVDVAYVVTGGPPNLASDIGHQSYAIEGGRTLIAAGSIGTAVVEIPRFDPGGEERGKPTVHEGVAVETIAVSDAFARAHRLVADRVVMIDVRDSSMSPTLEQGDQVIVDRSVDCVVEDGVYAIHHAGSLRIRRLQNRGDGSILVLSDNASYRPEVVGASEIAQHLVVIGRVLPFKFGRVRL